MYLSPKEYLCDIRALVVACPLFMGPVNPVHPGRHPSAVPHGPRWGSVSRLQPAERHPGSQAGLACSSCQVLLHRELQPFSQTSPASQRQPCLLCAALAFCSPSRLADSSRGAPCASSHCRWVQWVLLTSPVMAFTAPPPPLQPHLSWFPPPPRLMPFLSTVLCTALPCAGLWPVCPHLPAACQLLASSQESCALSR